MPTYLPQATPADCQPDQSDPTWWTKPKRKYCTKCKAIKPPRAHHCSVAGRCVVKMDHYCPWVNNTVGQNNHKFFLQFLVYVFIGTAYAALASLAYGLAVWQGWTPWPKWSVLDIGLVVAQVVLDAFFAIFVCAMMSDQFEAVCTDTTGIEAMKRWEERDWTLMQGLTNVMGGPLGLHWFIPTLPQGKALYQWSATDDLDAYDIRDPSIKNFFRQLDFEARLQELNAAKGEEGQADAPSKPSLPNLQELIGQDLKRVYDEQGRAMLVPGDVAQRLQARKAARAEEDMDMSSVGI